MCGVGWVGREIATRGLVSAKRTLFSHRAFSRVRFFASPRLSCPQSLTSRAGTGSPLNQDHGRLMAFTRVGEIRAKACETTYYT